MSMQEFAPGRRHLRKLVRAVQGSGTSVPIRWFRDLDTANVEGVAVLTDAGVVGERRLLVPEDPATAEKPGLNRGDRCARANRTAHVQRRAKLNRQFRQ
jgi:hypothetical protein